LLGKRLGKRMKEFHQSIQALAREQIEGLQSEGFVTVDGETFTREEIEVLQQPRPGTNTLSNGQIAVDLDTSLNDELVRGGYAREIVNRIQRHRKDLALNVADRIEVRYRGDQELLRAAAEHRDYIMEETLAVSFDADEALQDAVDVTIDERPFRFAVTPVVAEVERS
jgi:isoleucyl-tRNA synthetase